jgi:[ribosomal protein S18]-alanine N-acetyltransferase
VSVLARLLQREAPPAGVVIEPMRRRHLAQMMPIEQSAYPKPWSRSVFEEELQHAADGTRVYLVARRGRHVVGYAGLWLTPDVDGDHAHVTNVAVAAQHRRHGVATALLVALARAAVDRGCTAWTLEVRVSSTGAQSLYRRFGFVPAGVRRRYYENREDAIVMWCHDIQSDAYAERLRELACAR